MVLLLQQQIVILKKEKQEGNEIILNQLQLPIEKAIILIFSKLKIPDPKPFTEKQIKYKSWKADIINKIEIDNEKYTNDKQK